MSCGTYTFRTGKDAIFRWEAPEPVAPATLPVLSVATPDGAIAGFPALAAAVAPGTIDTISNDRRVLTLTGAIARDRARAAGQTWGQAFVITDANGWFPVRVLEISTDGTQITVDGLPRQANVTSGRIEWASYWTTLTSADVTASTRSDITWDVEWTPINAGTADDTGTASDYGRINVALRPFNTRLTDRAFVGHYPEFFAKAAGRDNSRSAVFTAALTELTLLMTPHIAPRGLGVDDMDGSAFQPAHAAVSAAILLERSDVDRADALREKAARLVEQAMQCAWADLDSDGEVDEGETATPGFIRLRGQRKSALYPNTYTRPDGPRWHINRRY